MKPWTRTEYHSHIALTEAYRRGDRPQLFFVPHFTDRYKEMGVTEDEVFECIAHPEEITYSAKHQAMTLKAGRVAIGVLIDDATHLPIAATLLWRYQDGWLQAAAEGRLGKGRTLYDDLSHLPVAPQPQNV